MKKITKRIFETDVKVREMSGLFLFDSLALSKWTGFMSGNRIVDSEKLAKAFEELIKEHNKLVKKHNELVEIVFKEEKN